MLILITEVKNTRDHDPEEITVFTPQLFSIHVLATGKSEEAKGLKNWPCLTAEGWEAPWVAWCLPASQKAARTGDILYVYLIQHEQVLVAG